MNNKSAFTLIELLVVIVIIGILSAFVYVGLANINKTARDSVRQADVNTYAKVLMMEKTIGSGEFPKEGTVCCLDAEVGTPLHCDNVMSSPKIMEIMTAIPRDPIYSGTTDHCYRYISNGSSATITVPLERGDIYTYTLGEKNLTETSSSSLSLTLHSSPSSIEGSWSRGSSGGDVSIVRKGMGEPPVSITEGDEVVNSSVESFNDSGLNNDTEYCYTLWNYNSTDGLYSKASSSCGTTYPISVTSLEVTPSSSSVIEISWVKSKPEYRTIIRRSTVSNPQSVVDGDSVYSGVSDSSFTDTGLSAGTTYYYSAFSHNETTNLDSDPISYSATTSQASPAAPTSLNCSASSSSSNNCSWSSSTGATSYNLQRDLVTVYTGSETSTTDTGLSCATSYSYQIQACNSGECSGWTVGNATTDGCGGTGSLINAINNMKGTGNGSKSAVTSYATIPVEYIEVEGDTTYSSNPVIGNTTADSAMLAMRYTGNLTINSGVVLTPQVRKKGMILFIDGTITVNGSISMTARGAVSTGDRILILINGSTPYEIPAVGAGPGSSGSEGATGGGGRGNQGGYGGSGTSYSGGAGGGGGTSGAGAGSSSGGAGGNAGTWSGCNGGGAGNPGGSGQAANGGTGTGGLLIIYANNVVVSSSGNIQANGAAGGTAPQVTNCNSGGGSGGGSINIFYRNSYTSSGSVAASGGAGGGNWNPGNPGGSGTVRSVKVD